MAKFENELLAILKRGGVQILEAIVHTRPLTHRRLSSSVEDLVHIAEVEVYPFLEKLWANAERLPPSGWRTFVEDSWLLRAVKESLGDAAWSLAAAERTEPESMSLPPRETPQARGKRRSEIIMPILDELDWTPSTWATEAGLHACVVYAYLKGETKKLRSRTRKELAQAIKKEHARLGTPAPALDLPD